MMHLKLGKKQPSASSSSAFMNTNMDESPSQYMDSSSVSSKEHGQCQSISPHEKNSLSLSESEIDELLQCPVCNNAMFPPIQQCPSGHALCLSCKNKVNDKCPICRKDMGNIRCLALEKLATSLHLPCAYHHLGCQKVFHYYGKVQHEAQCVYRPYTCPHPGSDCPFTGDIPALLLHLKERHKVDLQTGSTFNHRYVKQDPCSVDTVSWTLTLFNCYSHYFCLHFEAFSLGSKPVYMACLRFMGEESDARKFSYCLEVGNNGRKLVWHGVPRSIRTHHRTVRDSHDGLIIYRSLALDFSDGDKKELKLRVSGRIWKEIEEPKVKSGKQFSS